MRDRRSRGLPPQELLLSRPAEGVPDQPVRRTALRERQARRADRGRRDRDRDHARALGGGRGEERARRRVGRLHGATATLVDFNRGGTPLVEIVTEPDLHDADTAKRFLQLLRQTVIELDLSDAELEKGSMRFDVNVSVRPAGSDELRTRTELKNMNSFNFAAKGIEREIARQIRIYEEGGTVEQETLHFDPTQEDSPPAARRKRRRTIATSPSPTSCRCIRRPSSSSGCGGEIGELPGARIKRIAGTLSFYDADVLVTGGLDRLWSDVVAAGADAKEAANVLANQFVAAGISPDAVDAAELAKLVAARSEIPRAAFDDALAKVGDAGFTAAPYLEQKVVADASELDPIIDKIIEANPARRSSSAAARKACSASSSAR